MASPVLVAREFAAHLLTLPRARLLQPAQTTSRRAVTTRPITSIVTSIEECPLPGIRGRRQFTLSPNRSVFKFVLLAIQSSPLIISNSELQGTFCLVAFLVLSLLKSLENSILLFNQEQKYSFRKILPVCLVGHNNA